MFSGLKYIFGYADETESTKDLASSATLNNPADGLESPVSKGVEQRPYKGECSSSGTLLEQTLNAAATKFTEQLLPPQASIDQLQLSSQHLLPSINEQHEEEKVKDIKGISSIRKVVVDEDEDCLEVDSWELLDLVDKPEYNEEGTKEASCSLSSTVQKDGSTVAMCKATTSGILKTKINYDIEGTSAENKIQSRQQVRLKPKVSFETQDLVSSGKGKGANKIETRQKHHIDLPKTFGVKSKGKKTNKKTQRVDVLDLVGRDVKEEEFCEQKSSGKGNESGVSAICSAKIASNITSKIEMAPEPGTSSVGPQIKASNAPVLNYAAALSKKLNQNIEKSELAKIETSDVKSSKDFNPVNGSKKRNRAPSTSSWSSNDDLWPDFLNKSTNTMNTETSVIIDQGDDNESIMSSGFSDYDSRFERVNDWYLRPKKSNSKRGRNSSFMSSSSFNPLLSSMLRRGGEKVRSAAMNTKNSAPGKEPRPMDIIQASRSHRLYLPKTATKPEKKKINLAHAVNSENSVKSVDVGPSNKADDQAPSGSNDSSDVADMDESWYVTPPPCFTGANKLMEKRTDNESQPRSKEFARENDLIEHPSVPIPSKPVRSAVAAESKSSRQKFSKQNEGKSKSMAPAYKKFGVNEVWDLDDDDCNLESEDTFWTTKGTASSKRNKQVGIHSIVCAPNRSSDTAASSEGETLMVATDSSKLQATGKKKVPSPVKLEDGRQQSWVNKFSVVDWDFDDQEDADSDFDNMFVPVKKKKSIKTKRAQKKVNVSGKKESMESSGDDLVSDLSFELPSNSSSQEGDLRFGSAELISIKSSPSFDSPIEDPKSMGRQEPDGKENQDAKIVARRPPTQVRPIEPERRPGWQLKRQRSKRRPLTSSAPVSSVNSNKTRVQNRRPKQQLEEQIESDELSSARSTPTLIDRIGSSIVANLNNLTSGLVSSGALNSVPRTPLAEELSRSNQAAQVVCEQSVMANCNLEARKRMSKGYLKRQNISAQKASSQRRPGRQVKMFATQNGCSINRKVQSNFH